MTVGDLIAHGTQVFRHQPLQPWAQSPGRPAIAIGGQGLEAAQREPERPGPPDEQRPIAFRPIPERLARYIGAAAASRPVAAGTELDLTLTQAQLAARLGTVRELVARALSQLEENGVIARQRGRIVIRNPTRLAALARGEL